MRPSLPGRRPEIRVDDDVLIDEAEAEALVAEWIGLSTADVYRAQIEAAERGELVPDEEQRRQLRALGYLD